MKLVLAIAALALAIPAHGTETTVMQFPSLNCGTSGWSITPDPRDKTGQRKIAHCGKKLLPVPDVAVGLERVCASVKVDTAASGTVLTCTPVSGSKP